MRISDADRRDIWEAVQAQLSAFRRRDAEEAFRLASPGIRAMFGTADLFLEMVRSGYPFLCGWQGVRAGELVALQGQLAQQVEVRTRHEGVVRVLLLMERQPDGTWCVNGCLPMAHRAWGQEAGAQG